MKHVEAGVWDVAVAAGHRAAQALRTLEEITKIFDQTAAARCETLRYHLYGLDQQLQAALGSRRRRQWNLCVLLTESACTLPWLETAEAVIEAGADCINFVRSHCPIVNWSTGHGDWSNWPGPSMQHRGQ